MRLNWRTWIHFAATSPDDADYDENNDENSDDDDEDNEPIGRSTP